MSFKISDCDVIGFDLDMTLCRYRYSPMVRLCYESVADFLVKKKSYPKSLLDEFTLNEKKMVSRHQIVDFNSLNVKWINSDGSIAAKIQSINSGAEILADPSPWPHYEYFCKFGQSARGQFISMDSIFELGTSILTVRLQKLKTSGEIDKNETSIVADVYDAFEYNYQPYSFQIDQASIKSNPEKYVRRISPTTLSWLGQLKEKKKVFLMTSSNADYAKFILKSIFVNESGKEIDYWKYFDICIGDARKPYFFNMENPFFTNKNDYPDNPIKKLISGIWVSQGNVLDLERYFRTELHNNRFLVCYFGDSLKSDIISCDKTCGWKTVYLAEELLVDGDTSQLEDGDSDLLNTKDFWGHDMLSNSLQWKLATKHASLITPMIDSISNLPLNHAFKETIYNPPKN